MGFVHVGVWVSNPADRKRRAQIEFLADSGSLLSCVFDYDRLEAGGNVVFGDDGSIPLLGVTTVETMGATIDPIEQKLKPYKTLLACRG